MHSAQAKLQESRAAKAHLHLAQCIHPHGILPCPLLPQSAQAKLQESKDAKKKAAEEAGKEEDDDM